MPPDGYRNRLATTPPTWQRWFGPLATITATVTTLCCLGVAAMLSLASAVGATFLTRDTTLRPLLAVTLGLTVAGSALTFRRRGNPLPLLLTLLAAVGVYAAIFLAGSSGHGDHHDHDHAHAGGIGHGSSRWAWLGLALLVAVQLWDVWRVRGRRVPGSAGEAAPTTR